MYLIIYIIHTLTYCVSVYIYIHIQAESTYPNPLPISPKDNPIHIIPFIAIMSGAFWRYPHSRKAEPRFPAQRQIKSLLMLLMLDRASIGSRLLFDSQKICRASLEQGMFFSRYGHDPCFLDHAIPSGKLT